jgi:type IV pilus assembly protein PilA
MMFKRIRNYFKNQKGLTLVELLAVIVILGILAAIAVPSIGGIIDNSRKDAHIGNAKQMVAAAKLAEASNLETVGLTIGDGDNAEVIQVYTLKELIDAQFITEFNDPDAKDLDADKYNIADSYVKKADNKYHVFLVGSERQIGKSTEPEEVNSLTRDDVVLNP